MKPQQLAHLHLLTHLRRIIRALATAERASFSIMDYLGESLLMEGEIKIVNGELKYSFGSESVGEAVEKTVSLVNEWFREDLNKSIA